MDILKDDVSIPCTLMRGGTSRAPFFRDTDLPTDENQRYKVLLQAIGAADANRVNGVGGGDTLTNKIAVVSLSKREGIDVEYQLIQVKADGTLDLSVNCGNILSAVGPYAIDHGFVKVTEPVTKVRIFNVNTGVTVEATVQTPNFKINYHGDVAIDGVAGTAAPVELNFLDAVGAKTGKLLPTGKAIDVIDGVSVTCVDVAVPMVIIDAASLEKTGYELPGVLDSDTEFKTKLESIRRQAGSLMGLGDVSKLVMPKICIVSKPRFGGSITSRYFTPWAGHSSHAVTGALCLSAACVIPGSIANRIAEGCEIEGTHQDVVVTIEHPAGKIQTAMEVEMIEGLPHLNKAAFVRTARKIFDGKIFLEG